MNNRGEITSELFATQILTYLQEGKLLVVNPGRKNGLIIYKRYHAEFAGPGSVIGSVFDLDATKVLPVANLSLVIPRTFQEKISSYLIRRQWVRLIKQITDNPLSIERAQVILNQFEHWFDAETTAVIPDQAIALLVGVLPQTVKKVRHQGERVEI